MNSNINFIIVSNNFILVYTVFKYLGNIVFLADVEPYHPWKYG